MGASRILYMWIPPPSFSSPLHPANIQSQTYNEHIIQKELKEFSGSTTNSQILPLDPSGAFQCVCVNVFVVNTCEGIKVSVWPKTDYESPSRA